MSARPTALPAHCPDCGGRLTDGHDDGRDLVDVWCVNCDAGWTSTAKGWERTDSAPIQAASDTWRTDR